MNIPTMHPDISILLGPGGAESFDPVAKAGLSPAQTMRMEQLLIAVRLLKDGAGKRIMYDMDFWVAAQITATLFDKDGNAELMLALPDDAS